MIVTEDAAEAALQVLLQMSENSTDRRLRDSIALVRSSLRDELEAGNLEAAAPPPQPVVDREALVKAIDNAGALEVGGTNWPLDRQNVQEIADAVLALINGGTK